MATLSLRGHSARLPDVPALDAALAAALVTAAAVSTMPDPAVAHPATELVGAVAVGSTVLRTRAPMAMVAVASVAIALYALLPGTTTPLWTFVGILVVAFSTGAHLAGPRLAIAVSSLLGSGYLLQVETATRSTEPLGPADIWVSPLVIIGAPVLAGTLLRRSRRQTAELERLTRELETERERHAAQAVVAERGRIARELHDVISHAVTVMVVQAGAAEQLLPSDGAARARVRAVRDAGREALAELRRQLGLLREGPPPSSSPLPGLAQVPALVQASGATLSGDLDDLVLPPGLGLTVYRAVQEALTNAARHAPGATVRVEMTHEHRTLCLLVVDDGPGVSARTGAGVGLAGMRERVELYGGALDAGPTRHGWQVRARIPLEADPAGDDP